MAGKKKKGRRSLQDIADANAELRYGPEASALSALIGQAHSDYQTDVRSANALARTTVRSARASRPLLHKIYSQAASGVKAAQQDIDNAFNQAGVTPDNAFKIASDTEGTAYRQKMTAESAAARRESVRQEHDARLGKIFALGAAKDKLNSTLSQLNQRGMDLLGQRQAFLTTELGRMQDSAASRRNQRKVALIQQGIDPGTGKPIPGSSADRAAKEAAKKAKFDPASRSEKRMFGTEFARLYDVAQGYATDAPRKKVARNLRAGIPSAPTGEKGVRTPTIEASKNQLALRAALDMAYKGYLTDDTLRKMRESGLKIDSAPGARTYRQWLKGPGAAHRPVGTNEKAPF